MAVKPIPEGYEGATPYLIIDGAARALDFYQKAFGATVGLRMDAPGGKIGHADIAIDGRAHVMLADEYPDMGYRGPKSLGGTPVSVHIYVRDVDAFVRRAEEAGATVTRPAQDQFYGERTAILTDPFGHVWSFATRKEDLTPEEMQRRGAAAMGGNQG
jgi:PhnB protein